MPESNKTLKVRCWYIVIAQYKINLSLMGLTLCHIRTHRKTCTLVQLTSYFVPSLRYMTGVGGPSYSLVHPGSFPVAVGASQLQVCTMYVCTISTRFLTQMFGIMPNLTVYHWNKGTGSVANPLAPS